MLKFNKNIISSLVKTENSFILDLLNCNSVPDSVEDETYHNMFLLDNRNAKSKISSTGTSQMTHNADELEDRLNIIKNKMKQKKRKISERGLKKREAKKLKKNKEIKKLMASVHKSHQNEVLKVENGNDTESQYTENKRKPVFNEEGKIVFSKFDFASHPGAIDKKIKKKTVKNPKLILKQIKETDKKLADLKESGLEEEAKELKQELAWQKVFDKVEGKKVKDDPKLLYKALKKKKDMKLKSKKKWSERKEKVESTISQRQKKREDNINKKQKEKKQNKLKKLSKKGRIIPGF